MKITISNIKWDKPEHLTNEDCGLPDRIVLHDSALIVRLLEGVDTDAKSLYDWLFKAYGCHATGFTLDAERVDKKPWLTGMIE